MQLSTARHALASLTLLTLVAGMPSLPAAVAATASSAGTVIVTAQASAPRTPGLVSPAPTPASAASSPRRTAPSSAVEAAEQAQQPGKLRPENPVVPQIVLPLRADRDGTGGPIVSPLGMAGPGTTSPADGIDQQAARCAAQKTRAERQRCRGLSSTRTGTATDSASAPAGSGTRPVPAR